ncbi:hypothetical protein BT96DRAFT_1020774 [Gymnopus androsaceus JB14]|uniref:Uncharacterized protein n=1 Tax=Gymnopus androsaceus JB14 TaxID=1447944 RepID=A0A6A4HKA9_9AGAR|nr:hypothetical protein BT96DRAFT_1020774 [Gymnopus androsaceus JB14]
MTCLLRLAIYGAVAGSNLIALDLDPSVIQASLHDLFGAFQLYLEWIFIRARTGAASPLFDLRAIVNDQEGICHQPGVLIDCPLRPRHNNTIPDIDQKFFVLHKFIGDIAWMCGGADPGSDDEEDEEEYHKVLSNKNFDEVVEMLNSSRLDFFSREGTFGRTWVPKEVDVN